MTELFQTLKRPQPTLKTLDLDLHFELCSALALDLVVNRPRLFKLRLQLTGWDEMSWLRFPGHVSTSDLRSLDLRVKELELDWDSASLPTWLGNKLHTCRLDSQGASWGGGCLSKGWNESSGLYAQLELSQRGVPLSGLRHQTIISQSIQARLAKS